MPELAVTYRGVVYPWQCDQMGHMNVMHYVGKFDEATWQLVGILGITSSYLREKNRGMAAVKQNLAYKRELLPGDTITIRSGILEMKERSIHFFHEMVKDETAEIAAITVVVGVHIDTEVRKSCPFPEEILRRGRELIVEYDPGI